MARVKPKSPPPAPNQARRDPRRIPCHSRKTVSAALQRRRRAAREGWEKKEKRKKTWREGGNGWAGDYIATDFNLGTAPSRGGRAWAAEAVQEARMSKKKRRKEKHGPHENKYRKFSLGHDPAVDGTGMTLLAPGHVSRIKRKELEQGYPDPEPVPHYPGRGYPR